MSKIKQSTITTTTTTTPAGNFWPLQAAVLHKYDRPVPPQNDIALRVKSELFDWYPAPLTFAGEASSLPHGIFGAVYRDAADAGFVMVSQWTGEERLFLLESVTRDPDGDVQFWQFTDQEGRLRVHVLND